MTEPNAAYLDGTTPTVTLGGKAWPVPPMTFKQLRRLHALDRITKRIITDNTPLGELTEQEFDDLMQVIYVGLTRAHPSMTRDEFDAMEGTRVDLVVALPIVCLAAYGKPRNPPPGEGEGAESPQTGTA